MFVPTGGHTPCKNVFGEGEDAVNGFGGHSAGGYLTLMVALAKEYMAQYGQDADKIAKAYPISGQTVTHYTIREERGLPDGIPVIDEYAPYDSCRQGWCSYDSDFRRP